MSVATVGDHLIHYEALGRGQPVIFLHGWIGSWRYWLSTMQALSHRFRTYAVDLVGFGDSAKARQGADWIYRLERHVELVEGWMDHLGIQQAHFIGHTLGAMVAIGLAMRRPDRVQRILAVGYPVSLELPKGLLGPAGKGILAERLNRLAQEYPEVQREHLRADPEAIGRCLEETMTYQEALREWLRLVDRPLLLVYGQRDPLIPPPVFRNGDLDTSTRLIILEEGRHFPMLDLPAAFQRLAEDFLTLPDPSQIVLKEEWRRRFR